MPADADLQTITFCEISSTNVNYSVLQAAMLQQVHSPEVRLRPHIGHAKQTRTDKNGKYGLPNVLFTG